jgi:hypothetical protein
MMMMMGRALLCDGPHTSLWHCPTPVVWVCPLELVCIFCGACERHTPLWAPSHMFSTALHCTAVHPTPTSAIWLLHCTALPPSPKPNCNVLHRTLRPMAAAGTGADLEACAGRRDAYRKAANLLEAVHQLLEYFAQYTDIPQVRTPAWSIVCECARVWQSVTTQIEIEFGARSSSGPGFSCRSFSRRIE